MLRKLIGTMAVLLAAAAFTLPVGAARSAAPAVGSAAHPGDWQPPTQTGIPACC
jgi:hypothetical protein